MVNAAESLDAAVDATAAVHGNAAVAVHTATTDTARVPVNV